MDINKKLTQLFEIAAEGDENFREIAVGRFPKLTKKKLYIRNTRGFWEVIYERPSSRRDSPDALKIHYGFDGKAQKAFIFQTSGLLSRFEKGAWWEYKSKDKDTLSSLSAKVVHVIDTEHARHCRP